MRLAPKALIVLVATFGSVSVLDAQEPSGVADRLLEDLKDEPSVAESDSPPAWRRVAAEMLRISKQLPESNASVDTLAAQARIIQQLNRLLEGADASANTAESNSTHAPGEGRPKTGASKGADRPGEDQNSTATGSGPAAKAGQVGNPSADRPEPKAVTAESLMRRAWGQLPPRISERLQSGATEQFHKKYQAETEAYFRKLSEQAHRP